LVPPGAGLFFENLKNNMERKPVVFKSPDLSKLKEVIIDHRTRIYIALEADVEEARTRYLAIKNRKY
jgi:hypothetical protein